MPLQCIFGLHATSAEVNRHKWILSCWSVCIFFNINYGDDKHFYNFNHRTDVLTCWLETVMWFFFWLVEILLVLQLWDLHYSTMSVSMWLLSCEWGWFMLTCSITDLSLSTHMSCMYHQLFSLFSVLFCTSPFGSLYVYNKIKWNKILELKTILVCSWKPDMFGCNSTLSFSCLERALVALRPLGL